MKPLVVIPTYVTEPKDVALLGDCLMSVRSSEEDRVDILIVDDGSPAEDLMAGVARDYAHLDIEIHRKLNEGFSRAVNVGLRRALIEGRDAVLVNQDIEFMGPWLDAMVGTRCFHSDRPADVVGALLAYPTGQIQHGGVFFSLLTRELNHRMRYGPMNLPEALVPTCCPVTAALQFIRHETLMTVGIYDEHFQMGYEDMDYCVRVFLSGKECIYNPEVRAWHHESLIRGKRSDKLDEWHAQSYMRFCWKHQEVNFAALVPPF